VLTAAIDIQSTFTTIAKMDTDALIISVKKE